MSKKSIEDKFSIEMDAYLSGIEKKDKSKSKEYNELLELGKMLADKDFSKSSNKEDILNRALKNINKGESIMKKTNKNKGFAAKVASIATACIVTIGLTQTSFAQDLMEKIKKSISLDNVSIVQYEKSSLVEEAVSIPDEVKGKIFDKDGNVLEVFSPEYEGKVYTADGEEIFNIVDGDIITVSEQEKIDQEETLVVKDSDKVNDYACFDVKLPSYLSEGYKFDKAEFTKNEKGNLFDTFLSVDFVNKETGEYIVMHQRDVKIGGYATGTENEIKEVKINGVNAVIYDNTIDWETDKVIYGISGRGQISDDELIKIAESIK